MKFHASGLDTKEENRIPQDILEKIGITISECEICKQIHVSAKIMKGRNDWCILTTNKDVVNHINFFRKNGYCPSTPCADKGQIKF